jgi:hypothetical protein
MQRHHLPTGAYCVAKGQFGFLRIDVAAHDLGAFGAKQQCCRTAHAVTGSGDDADLVLQALRHGSLPGDEFASSNRELQFPKLVDYGNVTVNRRQAHDFIRILRRPKAVLPGVNARKYRASCD